LRVQFLFLVLYGLLMLGIQRAVAAFGVLMQLVGQLFDHRL
jgi:hypothetical protein